MISHKRKADKSQTGSQTKKAYSSVEHFWKKHYNNNKNSSLKAVEIYEFYKQMEVETYETFEKFKYISGQIGMTKKGKKITLHTMYIL